MTALPSAQELLPHAEAEARGWRNTMLGFVGVPLAVLGLAGVALMIAVGASGGSEGSELFGLLAVFGAVLFVGVATVVYCIRRCRNDPGVAALRAGEVVTQVRYSYLAQLRGHRKMVTYRLASGTFSCFVPNDFHE